MTCPIRIPLPYSKGAAVHWPGEHLVTLGLLHAECRELYRGIEASQMDGPEQYGAIAYQVLVCNSHGFVTEGRGRARQNGANGVPQGPYNPNLEYGSILALVGVGEKPSDALLNGVLEARGYLHSGKTLKTHNQVRPEATACPGPDLTHWIEHGYPAPEDDVALSEEDVQRVADAVWAKMTEDPVDKAKINVLTLVRRIRLLGAKEPKP